MKNMTPLMLMRKKGLYGSIFAKHANLKTHLSKSVGVSSLGKLANKPEYLKDYLVWTYGEAAYGEDYAGYYGQVQHIGYLKPMSAYGEEPYSNIWRIV